MSKCDQFDMYWKWTYVHSAAVKRNFREGTWRKHCVQSDRLIVTLAQPEVKIRLKAKLTRTRLV